MPNNSESFVLYETVYETFDQLATKVGKETACDFMRAICEYGLYGVIPEDDDILWVYGLSTVFHTICTAKDRYEATKANGKKGGRPKVDVDMEVVHQLLDQGWGTKEIANHLGVSDSTIKRRLNAEDAAVQNSVQNSVQIKTQGYETVQNLGSKLGSNQNLNVNVNVNDNVNENINDKEFLENVEPPSPERTRLAGEWAKRQRFSD